jgi:hypothetical protein
MKYCCAGAVCAVVLSAAVLTAQSPPSQAPTQTPSSSATQQATKAPEEQVTIVGCVQREADYRRANNLGRGGAVGTGAGVQNEFVLINASVKREPAPSDAPAGTSGTVEGTDAYELTGKNESSVGSFVGRRVEIVGKLKAAETGPAGTTGGASAAMPPTGVDVVSKDLKLREMEVFSVRETTGTCPASR